MDLLARIELPQDTGMADDTIVNTFAMTGVPSLTAGNSEVIRTAVANMFNATAPGAPDPLINFLAPELSNVANACKVKLYDITGKLSGVAPVGAPQYTGTWTLLPAPNGSFGMPAEVAFCVTIEADGRSIAAVEAPDGPDAGFQVDRPRQRLTGRMYLGSLNSNGNTVIDGAIRPSANLRDTARFAVKGLADAIAVGVVGASVGVWSRKNAAVVPVDAISTDNSYDTMRSRGPDPTARVRTSV
jgi:hypothetical protein